MMRIALGCFHQESQSFSPVPGSWEHFGPREVLRGEALIDVFSGTGTGLGGALGFAEENGIEVAPLLSAMASSSAGHLERDVFVTIRDELVHRLEGALPVDGVLLVLHGSMVVDGYDDGTGEILRAFRKVLGADVPLVGTLDLHANVTRQMVERATALVGYHTAPHVDLDETSRRGMRLLVGTIEGKVTPASALRRLPMILPGETARTTDGPYADIVGQAEALMATSSVLDASIFSVQPWLDVFDVASSVLVVTDGDEDAAGREADRLADEFWRRRAEYDIDLVPLEEAIRQALDSDRHPFVLADSADAPSSGAPGDSTAVLAALLEADPKKSCLHNIVDADAVEAMVRAGGGETVTVTVGAGHAPSFYRPLEVTGRVRLISDGAFTQKGPGFHGQVLHRGRTAVLRIGHIHLVVMERAVLQWDRELYRSVGLEPTDAQIVVVKSPAGFRADFGPIAAETLIVDAPGVCSPNLRALPFEHIRRPIHPLDGLTDWREVPTTPPQAQRPSP
jgi:microcystin degradation protein MlrC